MTHPATAYKVLTAEQMAALEQEGVFTGAPVDIADGYIHLSTAAQLTETVDKHFAGQTDLHIAAVDLEAMGEAVELLLILDTAVRLDAVPPRPAGGMARLLAPCLDVHRVIRVGADHRHARHTALLQ